jgi:hypothetical protein
MDSSLAPAPSMWSEDSPFKDTELFRKGLEYWRVALETPFNYLLVPDPDAQHGAIAVVAKPDMQLQLQKSFDDPSELSELSPECSHQYNQRHNSLCRGFNTTDASVTFKEIAMMPLPKNTLILTLAKTEEEGSKTEMGILADPNLVELVEGKDAETDSQQQQDPEFSDEILSIQERAWFKHDTLFSTRQECLFLLLPYQNEGGTLPAFRGLLNSKSGPITVEIWDQQRSPLICTTLAKTVPPCVLANERRKYWILSMQETDLYPKTGGDIAGFLWAQEACGRSVRTITGTLKGENMMGIVVDKKAVRILLDAPPIDQVQPLRADESLRTRLRQWRGKENGPGRLTLATGAALMLATGITVTAGALLRRHPTVTRRNYEQAVRDSCSSDNKLDWSDFASRALLASHLLLPASAASQGCQGVLSWLDNAVNDPHTIHAASEMLAVDNDHIFVSDSALRGWLGPSRPFEEAIPDIKIQAATFPFIPEKSPVDSRETYRERVIRVFPRALEICFTSEITGRTRRNIYSWIIMNPRMLMATVI